jgi:hypothetical protein
MGQPSGRGYPKGNEGDKALVVARELPATGTLSGIVEKLPLQFSTPEVLGLTYFTNEEYADPKIHTMAEASPPRRANNKQQLTKKSKIEFVVGQHRSALRVYQVDWCH